MHICFVAIDYHSESGGGGIASYVSALGAELVQQGHQVTVLAKGDRQKISDENGMKVVMWPFYNLSWYWHRVKILGQTAVLPLREIEWSLSINKALRFIHKQQPIDLIEICESGTYLLHRLGIPYIMRLHGEPFVFRKYTGQKIDLGLRVSRMFEFAGLRRANAVTSPSRFQANDVAHDIGWPTDRINVIPNPVAPWMIERAAETRSKVDNSSVPTVLYTGRIAVMKGPLVLLDAVDEVIRQVPTAEFLIVGGRHNSISESTLNEALARNDRQSHVKLPGHVPWQSLPAYYQNATLFVMPSYYETFSISCAEAMAFGLPAVVTRAGGLPEVVEDGVTGTVVPVNDPKALAEAIVALLCDPDRRAAMGERGQQRVSEHFTVQRVAEQSLELYRRLIH